MFREKTPILLLPTNKLMDKIIKRIEKERLRQNITQEELSKIAGIPVSTYRNFVYKKKISLENFLKILKRLRMEEAIRFIVDTPLEEEISEAIILMEQKKEKERKRARKKAKQ